MYEARAVTFVAVAVLVQVAATSAAAQPAPAARTQAGSIHWLLTAVGTQRYTDTALLKPINRESCESGAELHFALTHIPAGYKYLEVWLGDDCQRADRRKRIGSQNCQSIKVQEHAETSSTEDDFTIPIRAACEAGDGRFTFYVLPVSVIDGDEDAPEFARITLPFDQTSPDAPIDVHLNQHDDVVSVTWTASHDAFWSRIAIDPNAHVSSDAEARCDSALLNSSAGFDPSQAQTPDGIRFERGGQADSFDIPIDSLPDDATGLAVRVISLDHGQNPSAPSGVVCLALPGRSADTAGGGCSMLEPVAAQSRGHLPLTAALFLLGLALAIRARRRSPTFR